MDVRGKLVEFLNNSFVEQYEKRGLLTAQHTATDLIANGVTVQEWIPVIERGAYIGITSLVADVNVNEIEEHIRCGNLDSWVQSWQQQMAFELENVKLSENEASS